MYVDYNFYLSAFGEGLSEQEFIRAEVRAEAVMRCLTYLNGDIFTHDDLVVKMALCAATEAVSAVCGGAGASEPAKRSESNDGYSVTYVAEGRDGQTAEAILRKKVLEAIRPYLLPTGWLSRRLPGGGGCRVCADCCDDI